MACPVQTAGAMTLLRAPFLWASDNPFLAHRLPRYGFVRRAVRRFMPGERPEDALAEARRLAGRGAGSILTLLGEHAADRPGARGVVDHYATVLDLAGAAGVEVEISVKPTHVGLELGWDVAWENLAALLDVAAPRGAKVWLDMEGSATVDRTLALYRAARARTEHVGLALQAYLFRTPDDLEALLPLRPSIRLVKGAYMESHEVAHAAKRDVDRAFRRLTTALLSARAEDRADRPTFGTHDGAMIRHAADEAERLSLGRDRWEVAMLYGIRTAEQDRLVREGFSLRVLVSYGTHWFPWYMRRLAERPANVGFVLRQLLPI